MNKNLATFESSLPDDTVWDEQGDPITPGGRGLAALLQKRLLEAGWRCGAPEQHSFYGWSFTVGTSRGKVMVLVQYPGPWLLIATKEPSLWQRIRGAPDDDVDEKLLTDLQGILSGEQRITGARWHTRDEYFSGKAEHGKKRMGVD